MDADWDFPQQKTLRAGDHIEISGEEFLVIKVNDGWARVRAVKGERVKITTRSGKSWWATKQREEFNISPHSEVPVLRRDKRRDKR